MGRACVGSVGSDTRTFPNSLGEAAAALRELAEPIDFGMKVKVAIDRAARRSGLTYWRAFDLWYGKARRLEQFERDQLAEALEKKRKEAARNEFQQLRAQMARLESLLVQIDPDFHRESVAALRDQFRANGGANGNEDRTVAHKRRR